MISMSAGLPDYFDNPVNEDMFNFEELRADQVKDVFILLIIGIMISIAGYILEILKKYFNNSKVLNWKYIN